MKPRKSCQNVIVLLKFHLSEMMVLFHFVKLSFYSANTQNNQMKLGLTSQSKPFWSCSDIALEFAGFEPIILP